MTSRIFIDANVQVYAAGRSHLLREPCVQVLSLVAQHPAGFVTSAEVCQELLHRYLALRQWKPLGYESFRSFASLMRGRVEPIYMEDVDAAAAMAEVNTGLSSRDLLHVAVMRRLGCTLIASADKRFDSVADIERLDPADVDRWRERVTTAP